MRANGIQENREPNPSHGSDKPAVILDTNVIMHALTARYAIQAGSTDCLRPYHIFASRVFNHAFSMCRVCFTKATKAELRYMLSSRVGRGIRDRFVRQNDFGWIMARAHKVEPGSLVRQCAADPDDNHIIRAATGAAAMCIVTADRGLLCMGMVGPIRILNPESYIHTFVENKPEARHGQRATSMRSCNAQRTAAFR